VKYGLKMPMTQRLLLVRRLEGGLKIEWIDHGRSTRVNWMWWTEIVIRNF
jgi:hypothetical protein